MLGYLTTWLNDFGSFYDAIAANSGKILGTIAFMVTLCNRIAKLIPTQFESRLARIVSKTAYWFFAILGINVPDIAAVQDGKIVTTQAIIAQQALTEPPPQADPKA